MDSIVSLGSKSQDHNAIFHSFCDQIKRQVRLSCKDLLFSFKSVTSADLIVEQCGLSKVVKTMVAITERYIHNYRKDFC